MVIPKVEIWLYQDDGSSLCDLIKGLPEPQKERALELRSQRQRDYVIGRSLLALTLGQMEHFDAWRIKERPGLSPVIEHPSKSLASNISHSQGWVGLAFCETRPKATLLLGLDIEVVKPDRPLSAARYFCNSAQLDELNAIETSVDQSRYYSRLWTQKEAFFKAHQQTIWNPRLKSISFTNSQSKKFNKTGVVQSADYNHSLIISLCTDNACEIDTKLISELDQPKFQQLNNPALIWQAFCVEDEKPAQEASD